jgi:hypothetical protein
MHQTTSQQPSSLPVGCINTIKALTAINNHGDALIEASIGFGGRCHY